MNTRLVLHLCVCGSIGVCVGLCVLIGGCSAKYTEPATPAESPASADAQAAPLRERSRTLELAHAEPAGAAGGGHQHGGTPPSAAPSPNAAPGAEAGSDAGAGRVPSGEGVPSKAVYACPMHPEVTSEDPEARCPKCNMRLKKVEPKAGGSR